MTPISTANWLKVKCTQNKLILWWTVIVTNDYHSHQLLFWRSKIKNFLPGSSHLLLSFSDHSRLFPSNNSPFPLSDHLPLHWFWRSNQVSWWVRLQASMVKQWLVHVGNLEQPILKASVVVFLLSQPKVVGSIPTGAPMFCRVFSHPYYRNSLVSSGPTASWTMFFPPSAQPFHLHGLNPYGRFSSMPMRLRGIMSMMVFTIVYLVGVVVILLSKYRWLDRYPPVQNYLAVFH